ncbi:hypothetical protein KJZ71_01945 [Patescibacteria group bacterium]|uniref:Alpha/beta hydrolase n=1 Tax=candidate division WWE3 bacterium TaxID=2053526 RepID=A0A928TSG8_UNCKA|nr:hypothetical protein [candidate division WWE3 bacterium]MCL4732549.1 hypothetical protein [Patescibacteria group bacterium]
MFNRPFLSIAGKYDLLVPAERCRHPLAEYRVAGTDHTGLLFRKDVFNLVHQFIAAH